ncbi:methionyl-tRNA formyltransferase [Kaistia sp. 32K]|uniref:methionyl-tRNA formyltransferase n=1 Tax=Kaistia sp. 32K TaxID=2795690 RepID=UPI0019154813|nr:methionyl-tRNA formyltransferase [Kaistia sp. 32K]BCP53914.1 methionyl-tRNA formyltransferase [Kaistia sp. 32K]
MNIAFIGAVEGSAIGLRALLDAGLAPGLVITLPPEAARRHSDYVDLGPLAQAGGGALVHAVDINGPEALAALRAFETDLVLVIGWSQVCRDAFLSVARIGNVGFHPAALPHMRGRAVIPWTILLGKRETAATLFWLDAGVDSGPILLQQMITVRPDETARGLYDKQTEALARMLPEAVALVLKGEAPRVEQDHAKATYCARRTAEDGRIDWREPAEAVLRLIRAVGDPYPGAFTTADGQRLIVDAATRFADSHRFIGLPGQVQSHTPSGFTVRCGDGEAIDITAWRRDGGVTDRPRLHSKLGACLG